MREAHKHKERTYPELQGRNGRVRMVVIAGEIGESIPLESSLRSPILKRGSCERVSRLPGTVGGVVSSLASRLKQLLCRSWSVEEWGSQPTKWWWRPHSARCSCLCFGLTVHVSHRRKKNKRICWDDNNHAWSDIEPSKQDLASHDLSKKIINLLRHKSDVIA